MKENADISTFALCVSAERFFVFSALRANGGYFMKKNQTVLKTAIMAMLTAVSIVLVYFIHLPLIPGFAFLEYDPADIPVLIGAMMLGPVSGIVILLAVCLIQALTVSAASGWIGFVMHFVASSVLILIPSIIYRKKKTITSLVVGLILGVIAMTAVMIPLNLVFTGIFMGTGVKAVASLLIPAIIPFNLAKAAINAVVTFAVFTPISKVLEKYIKI